MLFSQINFIFPVMLLCDNHFSLSLPLLSPSSSLWNRCSKNFLNPKVQKFLTAAIYLAPCLTNLTVPETLSSKRIHSRQSHRAKGIIVPFWGTEHFGLGQATEENLGAATAKKNPNPLCFHHSILFAAILLCRLLKNNLQLKKERKRKQSFYLFPPTRLKEEFKIWNRTSFDSLGV